MALLMSELVITEKRGAVLEIVLNRPERLNSFGIELLEQLHEALGDANRRDVRAVMLRGAGRGFCGGGDLRYFAQLIADDETIPNEMPDELHRVVEDIRRLPKPVLAMVHGGCAGGGLALTLACDMAIASDDAVFSMAYTKVGLSPDGGTSFFLPRHLGFKRSLELMMKGDRLTAAQALELGLVNRVVPASELLHATRAEVAALAAGPSAAYARIKELVRRSFDNDLRRQLAFESEMLCESSETADFREGVAAFFDKRAPSFVGR